MFANFLNSGGQNGLEIGNGDNSGDKLISGLITDEEELIVNHSSREGNPVLGGGETMNNEEAADVTTTRNDDIGFSFTRRRVMSARDRKKCLRHPSTIEDLVYSINNDFDGAFDDDDDDDDVSVDGSKSSVEDEDEDETERIRPGAAMSSSISTGVFDLLQLPMNSSSSSSSTSSSSSASSQTSSPQMLINHSSSLNRFDDEEETTSTNNIIHNNPNTMISPSEYITTHITQEPTTILPSTTQTDTLKRKHDNDVVVEGAIEDMIMTHGDEESNNTNYMSKKHRQLLSSNHITTVVPSEFNNHLAVNIENNERHDALLFNESALQHYSSIQGHENGPIEPNNNQIQVIRILTSAATTQQPVQIVSQHQPSHIIASSSSQQQQPSVIISAELKQPVVTTPTVVESSTTRTTTAAASTAAATTLPRPRPKNLPDRAVNIMLAWWNEHINNPFPNESERSMLAAQGEISSTQVRQWFANRRMRRMRAKRARSSPDSADVASSVAAVANSVIGGVDCNNNQLGIEPPVTINHPTTEIDRYNESIDFVIKSLDDQTKNSELDTSVNNTQSILTELSQPKQYQAAPIVQAPKRGGSRLNRSKTLNPNQLNQPTTTNINSNQSIILALEQQQQQQLQQSQTQTNKTVSQPITPAVPKVKKVTRPKPLLLNQQQQQQQQQPVAQNSPPIGLLNRPLVNVFVSPSSAAAPLSQPQLSPHLNQLNAHHTIDYHKYFANQSAANDGFINAAPTPTSTPASAVDIYADPNRYLYQPQQQQQTSCYNNTTGYSNNAYLAHGSHKMMANQALSHYDTAYFSSLCYSPMSSSTSSYMNMLANNSNSGVQILTSSSSSPSVLNTPQSLNQYTFQFPAPPPPPPPPLQTPSTQQVFQPSSYNQHVTDYANNYMATSATTNSITNRYTTAPSYYMSQSSSSPPPSSSSSSSSSLTSNGGVTHFNNSNDILKYPNAASNVFYSSSSTSCTDPSSSSSSSSSSSNSYYYPSTYPVVVSPKAHVISPNTPPAPATINITVEARSCPCCIPYVDAASYNPNHNHTCGNFDAGSLTSQSTVTPPVYFNACLQQQQQQFKCETPPPMNINSSTAFINPQMTYSQSDDKIVSKVVSESSSDETTANKMTDSSNNDPEPNKSPKVVTPSINQVTLTSIRVNHVPVVGSSSNTSSTSTNSSSSNSNSNSNSNSSSGSGQNLVNYHHPFSNLNLALGAKIDAKQTKPISISMSLIRSLQQDQQQKNSNNNESETQSRISDSRSKEWCMSSHPRLFSTLLSPSMNPVTNVEATVSSASETSSTSYNNLENHQESSSTNDDDKAKSTN